VDRTLPVTECAAVSPQPKGQTRAAAAAARGVALLLQTVVRRKTVWVLGAIGAQKVKKKRDMQGSRGEGEGEGGGEGGLGRVRVVAVDWAACAGAARIGCAPALASPQVD
jgi:hypothetical protein